jgi:hypothetical protein
MSVEAITWVLNGALGVKPHFVSTLLGLANHAGPDGRGAYPSQAKLAVYTRKSVRAVRKDLAEMERAGLIRRGDQRLVEHLPPDRRPVVYDLVMISGNDQDGRNHSSPRNQGSARNSSTERGEPQFRTGGNHSSAKPSFEPSITTTPPTPPQGGRTACNRHRRRRAGCADCAAPPRTRHDARPVTEALGRDGCAHGAPPGTACALCRRGIPAEEVS